MDLKDVLKTDNDEANEMFRVVKQLLSSHSTRQPVLQMGCDSLLSLRVMLEQLFLNKKTAQQLAMYGSISLPPPALRKSSKSSTAWTVFQIIQLAFPERLSCKGERFMIDGSDFLSFDFEVDTMAAIINDIVISILWEKGPKEALGFFDSLQPLLIEHISTEGFSVSLEDLSMSKADMEAIHNLITREISPIVSRLGLSYEDELQLENSILKVKEVATKFMLKSYSMQNLIDIKSNSAVNKLVQQIGFLGLQLSDKKLYTKTLVEDMAQFCNGRISSYGDFGMVKGCFFHGLDPCEEMAHSIAVREAIVHSSKAVLESGLCEVNFQNTANDRRVILYLNECQCGKRFCQKKAACTVRSKLKKVTLQNTTLEFLVEYRKQPTISWYFRVDSGPHGHIHLKKTLLEDWNISMQDILQKCEHVINSLGQKKKKGAEKFKRINLSVSEGCSFSDPCARRYSDIPCVMFQPRFFSNLEDFNTREYVEASPQ